MLEALADYSWPGNIRELENIIEQAVIVNQSNEMLTLARPLFYLSSSPFNGTSFKASDKMEMNSPTLTKADNEEIERSKIIEALQLAKGRIRGKAGAAALLSVKPTTLESKMKKYKISKYTFQTLGS